MRRTPPGRAAFALFRPIQTRWADNDLFGHVNNVTYYAYFDTAVNGWLLEAGLLALDRGPICLVAATECQFFAPAQFPDALEAGLAVGRLGRSSVTYEIGIFRAGAAEAAAAGRFTHVHVDREDRRPQPFGADWRAALTALMLPGDAGAADHDGG